MKKAPMKKTFAFVLLILSLTTTTQAEVIVSEVHSTGSSSATYAKDWFELTNTGLASIDITGWKVDDSSNAAASALLLRNVTSINPGQSVVFIETDAAGATDATVTAAFTSAWFGANIPVGFTIGTYGGSGIGLGSGGDAVNIFNASDLLVTGVTFGAGTLGTSFDNAAGLTGPISQLSAVGVNAAFTSVVGSEVGSPGLVAAIPEPSSLVLLAFGFGATAWVRRRK
jgi:Lamin Tail Domain/PEP-CTERM motif